MNEEIPAISTRRGGKSVLGWFMSHPVKPTEGTVFIGPVLNLGIWAALIVGAILLLKKK